MNFIKVLVAVAFIVLFLVFVAQHAYYVQLNFFGMAYQVPLFVIILFSFSLGFILPTLYFLIKDIRQSKFRERLMNGISHLARGYFQKAEGELLSASKKREEVALITLKALVEKGEIYRAQELKFNRERGLVDALTGYYLLKAKDYQKAKESFLSALSKDPHNLTALKGLRDISFLEKDILLCVNYQEKIIKLCEKWEKDMQKKVFSEVLAYASEILSENREELLKKALDAYKTFYTQAIWIKYLLEKGDVKEAKKQLDKVFSVGIQNKVLAILHQDEERLTQIMDIIREKQESINPEVLVSIYIKLSLFTQIKPLLDKVSEPLKLIAISSESHRDLDKTCGEMLQKLYKPWVCSCGESYNSYVPLCERCLTWGNIMLRGVEDVA
jgi:uncharacterized integral membrane protein